MEVYHLHEWNQLLFQGKVLLAKTRQNALSKCPSIGNQERTLGRLYMKWNFI